MSAPAAAPTADADGADPVPYRAPGRVRQTAYGLILAFAAAGASAAAWWFGAWGAAPGCLAAYLLAYLLHERVLWRAWRRWHAIPDLSGHWRCGDDRLRIRQTWTRLSLAGTIGGSRVSCRLAGWWGRPAVLRAVLDSAAGPPSVAHLRLDGADALLLDLPAGSGPGLRWRRLGPTDADC